MKFSAALLLVAFNGVQSVKLSAPGDGNCDGGDDACWAKKNFDLRFGPEGQLETQKKENEWTNGSKKIMGTDGGAKTPEDGSQPFNERYTNPLFQEPWVDGGENIPEAKRWIPKDAAEPAFVPPRVGTYASGTSAPYGVNTEPYNYRG